ncbi:MAG: hypothetical protein NTW50_03860 [Candidatus Berkelbacteria bacterium]|nr:hypothetical protein [Candidatus Berkelbacteria bacterium]
MDAEQRYVPIIRLHPSGEDLGSLRGVLDLETAKIQKVNSTTFPSMFVLHNVDGEQILHQTTYGLKQTYPGWKNNLNFPLTNDHMVYAGAKIVNNFIFENLCKMLDERPTVLPEMGKAWLAGLEADGGTLKLYLQNGDQSFSDLFRLWRSQRSMIEQKQAAALLQNLKTSLLEQVVTQYSFVE